jgi:concanavalin A-like lectin/glucanase superfamily protein
MKIYKDGDLINSKEYPQELLNTVGKDLRIGSGDSHSYYSGLIDEIRIYNKVLTDTEISQLYFE